MKDNCSNLWRGRFFRYAPLVIWVGVVLFASTGSASMPETSRFIRPLLHLLFPKAAEETLQIYHGYIRKLAHLTEYALLAFFASRALFYSNKNFFRRFWHVFAFAAVVLVASIDETNQSYNVSRTGSVRDVLLDATGGAAMILLYYSTAKYGRRHSTESERG